MTSPKQNCWEAKNCGRQLGGAKTKELGICPSATEARLHGVHGGRNAGRSCWVVAGTFCGGKVQGSFATKFQNCKDCDFYKTVVEEESHDLQLSMNLTAKLKSQPTR
jgi:hypothetical protein